MAKKLNERCPLQAECERKCEFQFRELDCEYYANNGVGEDRTIPDQEDRRQQAERERMEELLEIELDSIEDEEPPVSSPGNIIMLPIDTLHPHPDNPRKDVGDISELAESIKVNGVLQNLTVVPGHWMSKAEWKEISERYSQNPTEEDRVLMNRKWLDSGYTVIIGHRRLAASKQAGLTELPCVIVEMTQKEQVATMLTENMQRVDLTVYEQANGFQMMLDLGDSMEQIAEKSGFSKTTVRKRLEIAKLDQKTLKRVSERQLSIGDFDELAKIDDIGVRNKLLSSMGTANFKNELQTALKNQQFEQRLKEWLEVIRTFATEDPEANYQNRQYVRNYGYYNMSSDVVVPEDVGTRKYYYKISSRQVDIYTDKDLEKEAADKAAREENARLESEERQRWDDINERHFDLRRDFIKNLSNAVCRKNAYAVYAFVANAVYALVSAYKDELDLPLLSSLLGVRIDEKEWDGNGLTDYSAIRTALEAFPEKTLMCMAYCCVDHEHNGYFRRAWKCGAYEYVYGANPELDSLYATLTSLGYEMSDEEKQMQSGDHPWFQAEDDDKLTPEDLADLDELVDDEEDDE